MNAKEHIDRAEELLRQSERGNVSAENRDAARSAAGVHASLATARELHILSEWIVLAAATSVGVAAGVIVPGVPDARAGGAS